MLLSKYSNPNVETDRNFTPLHIACFNLHDKAVKLLLDHNVDVNVKDVLEKTVLHHVAGEVDGRFNLENISYEEARTIKQKITLRILLSNNNADLEARDKVGKTPIFYAVEASDVKVTNMLLAKGAQVNVTDYSGMTPLYYTVINKQELVKSFDNRGKLMSLYKKKFQTETLKLLLKSGVDNCVKQPTKINTVLHVAMNENNLDVMDNLLKAGFDIDMKDSDGLTPLQFACRIGNVDIVDKLLTYGPDINVVDNYQRSPLMYAVNTSDGYCYSNSINNSLLNHVMKLIFFKLYVSNENIENELMVSRDSLELEGLKVARELLSMQETMIGDTNVNFYELLMSNKESLLQYIRNKKIVQVLGSRDYEKNFPLLMGVIWTRLRESMKKIKLIDTFLNCNISLIFPNIPVECVEKVLKYLENNDLEALINSTD